MRNLVFVTILLSFFQAYSFDDLKCGVLSAQHKRPLLIQNHTNRWIRLIISCKKTSTDIQMKPQCDIVIPIFDKSIAVSLEICMRNSISMITKSVRGDLKKLITLSDDVNVQGINILRFYMGADRCPTYEHKIKIRGLEHIFITKHIL